MRIAPCPSCGAQVTFHSAASIMAVCAFCRSTLVRHDADLESLGKMAELAEDRSPFALGFRGSYRKVGFELIGRLQLSYAAGYWNEWYTRFDDGRLGWLSEGSGLCYVTFEQAIQTILPALAAFQPGMSVKLDGKSFTVSNIEQAKAVAIAGELPFQAMPGYEAPAVDLRVDNHFASLDYSETPPKVYIGETVSLDQLLDPTAPQLAPKLQRTEARGFKCGSCGAPLSVRGPDIRAVGCGHCGSIIDPADPNLAIISRSRQLLFQPTLEVGSQGKLRGRQYTLIGYLKRSTTIDGTTYSWDEYLLHAPDSGYAWLIESDGHWSLAKPVTSQPTLKQGTRPQARFLNRNYRHFQHCEARVSQVLGEFTWRVALGETVTVDDYVSPPYSLSAETTDQEISWTLAEYLPVEEVAAAFKPLRPLQPPRGVAPNQPSPGGGGRYWLAFGGFAVLALVLQLLFTQRASQRTIWQGQLAIPSTAKQSTMSSPPIHIDGSGNLLIAQVAPLDNRWLYTDLALVEKSTGQSYRLGREISYYQGADADGGWSEGSITDEALLAHVPAGDYVLEVEAETEPANTELVDSIQLVRDVPIWINFWLLLTLLACGPLLAWWRSSKFEASRWSESDYGSGSQ